MASTIKVDNIEGSTGSTITVPTGQTLALTDGLAIGSLPTVTVAKGGTGLAGGFTAGDVLYATGSTTLAKLPKGTAEQILSMNSGATLPEWTSADISVLPTITVAKGGTGQAGGFTQGDFLYATDATTLAKLAKGTASQTLKMNAGATAPEWATVAAASADFVKIATAEVTGSSVSSIDLQGCFTSTYDSYQIHFNRLDFTGNAYLYPVFLDDSNAALTTTHYTKGWYMNGEYNSDGHGGWNVSSGSGFNMSNSYYSYRASHVTSGIIYLPDPRSTRTPGDGYKTFWWTIFGGQSSHFWRFDGLGQQSIATPYGGIQFKGNGNNIKVGFKATVYGLRT